MGSAISQNVATSVADALTQISTQISTNSVQADTCGVVVKIKNCIIWGPATISAVCNTNSVTDQITKMQGTTTLQNIIAQSMIQTAVSKVGTWGIGFADSVNVGFDFANATKNITEISSSNSVIIQNQFVSLRCENQELYGNIDISIMTSADFLAKQAQLKNEVTQVANIITQSMDQKARAEVEGIGGFVIAFVVLALGSLFVFEKTMTRFIIPIMAIIFIGIGFLLKFLQAPPLFNTLDLYVAGDFWKGYSGCKNPVVNASQKSITVDKPPIRYMFPIITKNPREINLFDLAVTTIYPQIPYQKSNYADIFNQYNTAVSLLNGSFPDFAQLLSTKAHPLLTSSGINRDAWLAWITNPSTSLEELSLARTVLLYIIINGRIGGNELSPFGITLNGSSGYTEYVPQNTDNVLTFTTKNGSNIRNIIANGTAQGGTINGQFGYCQDNTYRIQHFLYNQYGWWISGGILTFLLIVLWIVGTYGK